MSTESAMIKELGRRLAECETESRRAARIQSALYQVADAASSATDMQQFYRRLHEIIAGLMYAENLFIATYEASSGMLSFPYFVDASGDEAPAPTPLSEFHGGTSYVIRTGSLQHASRERAAE
jgi:hypothetical protein